MPRHQPSTRSHRWGGMLLQLIANLACCLNGAATLIAADSFDSATPKDVANISTRWELFVDNWLIATSKNAALKLNPPELREVVLVTDAPWEGSSSAYFSVVQHDHWIRLYYRGSSGGSDLSADQVTCVAESRDGVHFTRPTLGIVDVKGSKDNSVIWKGI